MDSAMIKRDHWNTQVCQIQFNKYFTIFHTLSGAYLPATWLTAQE